MSINVACEDLDLEQVVRLDPFHPPKGKREELDEVRVDVRCDHLQYQTFEASQVRATASRHNRQVDFTLEEATVADGQLRGEGTFWLDSDALSFKPHLNQVNAPDFFAAVGHPSDIISGSLDAYGDIEVENWEFWDDPEEWDGELTFAVQDGVAQQLPILVRLWTAVSLQSILSFSLPQLPREGLSFSSLTGDMVIEQGQLTTENLSLTGEAVRLDIRGQVNLRQKSVDLITNVVPLRGITSVVEKVPFAGQLLAQRCRSLDDFTLSGQGAVYRSTSPAQAD